MSEQSMKCKDCVLKHIANAMSYAKEILAGHGIGGTPDHRPDYLGELVNAENHLEHISIELLNRVMVLRTAAQTRRMVPLESDIDSLREIWIAVEKAEVPEGSISVSNIQEATPTIKPDTTAQRIVIPTEPIKYDTFPGIEEMEKVGILLDDAWYLPENKDKWDIFIKLIKKNLSDYEIIFKEHLSKENTNLEPYTGKYMWVFPLNVFVANATSAKKPATAAISFGNRASSIMRIVKTEDFKKVYAEDEDKTPCEVVDSLDLSPLPTTPEDQLVLGVYRKPCCSIKARLNTAKFIKVNDEGWPYMKEIWEIV